MNRVCLYTGPGSLIRAPEDVTSLLCVDAVPENLESFVNLVHFSLVGETEAIDCPYEVYECPTLKHLHVEGKVNLEFILEDMTNLRSLTIENLYDRDFNKLHVGELCNLEYLCIKNTELELSGLVHLRNNLKHLILKNTGMEFLPRSVYRLWNLRTLDISENTIGDVSRRITGLLNLKNFAWSHKTRPADMELMFSVVPDRLPEYFYELMRIDISRKSREDYMSEEIYDQFVPMIYDGVYNYSDDEEDAETVFDDFLNDDDSDFDEMVPATLDDEGYESDYGEHDGDDDPVLNNPPDQDRPEFQLDYIFQYNKRVPDWEFLYDSDDDNDSDSDDDDDFKSATNSDADYDSDYECDYENERI